MEQWTFILQIVFIALLTFVSKLIKEKLPFLNKVVLPTALIAGFLGLFISYVFPLFTIDHEVQKNIVYHTMAIGFIALSLKDKEGILSKTSWSTGGVIVMTYAFQGIIGFSIIYFIYKFIDPNLFPGMGLLLPLGFGQGPGYAYSIGSSWETYIQNGGDIGLTIATIGFLWGGFFGVIVLNYYIRKFNISIDKFSNKKEIIIKDFEFKTVKELRFFDSLTTQITIILVIYFFVYLTVLATQTYLPMLGAVGETLAGLFKGFHFLFGILYALLFKRIQQILKARRHRTDFLTNNYLLSNTSSYMFNLMITAGVLAITIENVEGYLFEILLITTVGGILTFFFLNYITRRLYNKHVFEYLVALYGMLTGTASTGIALLKGIDPDLDTDVAENMVLGSATGALLGLPMFGILTIPVIAYTNNSEFLYIVTIISLIVYLILVYGFLHLLNRK